MRTKKQAIAALKVFKKSLKKRCPLCGHRFTVTLIDTLEEGPYRFVVMAACNCRTITHGEIR